MQPIFFLDLQWLMDDGKCINVLQQPATINIDLLENLIVRDLFDNIKNWNGMFEFFLI